MRVQHHTPLEWLGVLLATIFMLLASALVLYPTVSDEAILTALRLSSVTTAIPFLLVFIAEPILGVASGLGQWLQANRRPLWLILTISHLIHLYQIVLYYQLGQQCSLLVWGVTSPLWIIMVTFSGVAIAKPSLFDRIAQGAVNKPLRLLYRIGIWYIWLVFTLAFGLGTIANHLPFYNIPAFVLFLAAAILHVISWRRPIARA